MNTEAKHLRTAERRTMRVSDRKNSGHDQVLSRIRQLYFALIAHDGYGDIRIEVRILKRGQKEVIVHCGKQYRFVVDGTLPGSASQREEMPLRTEAGQGVQNPAELAESFRGNKQVG